MSKIVINGITIETERQGINEGILLDDKEDRRYKEIYADDIKRTAKNADLELTTQSPPNCS